MKSLLLTIFSLSLALNIFSQKTQFENVNYFDIRTPNQPLDKSIESYKVYVEIPYTLTVEEVSTQSLEAFEEKKADYENVLKKSEIEFQEKLKNHDKDILNAEKHYKMEMEDFKELSLLERLAITEQGKKPKLVIPSKPRYVKPREPYYSKPNLDDHLIFDANVLADAVKLKGYENDGNDIVFAINISKMNIQDNAGQTFYNQPTNLTVMKGSEMIYEKNFDEEFKFLTSSSSNNINLDRYEKSNVKKIMRTITKHINEEFGFIPVASHIKIEFPKNKKRTYDNLENAKIKAISAYRKLKKTTNLKIRAKSKEELKSVITTWENELTKVNYSDKKAVMNKKIAKIIFFNIMRVKISLKDKTDAEKTLNKMQEKRIDLDLNYNEKLTFTRLEEKVYNMK